jgi:hypothetical protein
MNDRAAPNLEIQLELPEQAKAGEAIPVQLVITNRSDHDLSLVTPLYNAALNLVVFDALWNMVLPQPIAKAHVAFDHIELAPNSRVTVSLVDLSYISGTAHMQFKLDPGAYYVNAVYHPGTARLPEDSAYPIVAVSNVARLIISGSAK